MSKPRSRQSRIPHLEYRPQGYVWRRRLPRRLLALTTATDRQEGHGGDSPFADMQPDCGSAEGIQTPKDLFRIRENSNQTVAVQQPQPGKIRFESPDIEKTLCLSLKTDAFSVAAELARRLTHLSEQTFLYATTTMTLTAQETATVLTALARFEIEAADQARVLGDPRSPGMAHAELEREVAVQATLRDAFARRDYSVATAPLAHVADLLGIDLPDQATEDARLLAYEATRVLLDVSQECASGSRRIFPAQPVFQPGDRDRGGTGDRAALPARHDRSRTGRSAAALGGKTDRAATQP